MTICSSKDDDIRFIFDSNKFGYSRLKFDRNSINKFKGNRLNSNNEMFSNSIGTIIDDFKLFLDGSNTDFMNQKFKYHNIWICEEDEIMLNEMWKYIKKGGSQSVPLRLAIKLRIWNNMIMNIPIKTPDIYNSPIMINKDERLQKIELNKVIM